MSCHPSPWLLPQPQLLPTSPLPHFHATAPPTSSTHGRATRKARGSAQASKPSVHHPLESCATTHRTVLLLQPLEGPLEAARPHGLLWQCLAKPGSLCVPGRRTAVPPGRWQSTVLVAHYLCSLPLVKDHGQELGAGTFCLVIRLGRAPGEHSSKGQELGACTGGTPALLDPTEPGRPGNPCQHQHGSKLCHTAHGGSKV